MTPHRWSLYFRCPFAEDLHFRKQPRPRLLDPWVLLGARLKLPSCKLVYYPPSYYRINMNQL